MNGEQLTLRPRTPPASCAPWSSTTLLYDGGKRLWYMGPMFRHERPQRGPLPPVPPDRRRGPGLRRARRRRRTDPAGATRSGSELGFDADVRLEINSLGQPAERRAHRAAADRLLRKHADTLDEDARRRLHSNPLRILDTKNPAMQAVVEVGAEADRLPRAPSRSRISTACKAMLDANGIAYTINPRLVRGMDYYNLTRVRVRDRQPGRAGHGLRRRPLRRPDRADRRQARARRRLRPGHRARAATDQGAGHADAVPAPDVYAVVPDAAAMPRGVAHVAALARRRRQRARCTPAGRRPGQHEVAVQEGRRQRRARMR